MTAAERFEAFYEALHESNAIWWDALPVTFPNHDYRQAAKKVWLALHNEGKIKKEMNWVEARNYVKNELIWQGPITEATQKPEPAKVEIAPNYVKWDTPEYQNYLEQWKKSLSGLEENVQKRTSAIKETVTQLPKPEGAVYHPPTDEEVMMRDLHIQYLRECYHPVTKEKLPAWIPEREWLKNMGI